MASHDTAQTSYPAPDSDVYAILRRNYLGPEWWATEYRRRALESHREARSLLRLGYRHHGKDKAREALHNWQLMRQELDKIKKGYW